MMEESNINDYNRYLVLIQKYKQVKENIQSTFDYFSNVNSALNVANENLTHIIINGESIDKGRLEKISFVIKSGHTKLEEICAECDKKINEYSELCQEMSSSKEYETLEIRKKIEKDSDWKSLLMSSPKEYETLEIRGKIEKDGDWKSLLMSSSKEYETLENRGKIEKDGDWKSLLNTGFSTDKMQNVNSGSSDRK